MIKDGQQKSKVISDGQLSFRLVKGLWDGQRSLGLNNVDNNSQKKQSLKL